MMSKGGFREGRGCVDKIFTQKQISEKARDKKRRVYVGFKDFEKAYGIVNREALWQVLSVYDGRINCWGKLRVCMLII